MLGLELVWLSDLISGVKLTVLSKEAPRISAAFLPRFMFLLQTFTEGLYVVLAAAALRLLIRKPNLHQDSRETAL